MCTVTFIPANDGYVLAMNRDERITRARAVPPDTENLKGTSAVFPRDAAGGTWIGVSEFGISFALLNQNDRGSGTAKVRSRGEIIPELLACPSAAEAGRIATAFDYRGMWPFRLVGVFHEKQLIKEWQWNGRELLSQTHDWGPRHWFSSSLSDEQAAQCRGEICRSAWNEADAGSLTWLRRLHQSHESGRFSICVHRDNVRTLSYSEIVWDRDRGRFSYFDGSPCGLRKELDAAIRLTRRSSRSAVQ